MLYTITYIERGTEEVKTRVVGVNRKDSIITWLNAAAGMNVRMFTNIQSEKERNPYTGELIEKKEHGKY